MALTTLQLQAAAGLMQNTGVRVAPALTDSVAAYQALAVITPIRATITQGAGILSNATTQSLQTFAASSCPALADNIPSGHATLAPLTDPSGFSGLIATTAESYLGSGDVSKFAQALSTAVGYCTVTNEFINAAANAETFQANTFSGINNMMSGDLTAVTLATQEFGRDLAALGNLIDLAYTDVLGSPAALLRQLARLGAATAQLMIELGRGGLPTDAVIAITRSQDRISPTVEKIMYQAMTQITGDDLSQVKQILGVSATGVNTMADLLNPAVIFPTSYTTLITPTCSGNANIYVSATTVNGDLAQDLPVYAMAGYQQLTAEIPPEWALANRALSVSLQQITNITQMTLPALAQAYLAVETAQGLPLVESQTQALEPGAGDYFQATVATGSGINGTVVTTDVLGTASGTGYVSQLANATQMIGQLQSSGDLDTLTGIYQSMLAALSGANPNSVIADLIALAQTEIAAIVAANPDAAASLNDDFSAMANHMTQEFVYQAQAGLSITDLQSGVTASTQGLVAALPGYGQDTESGGTAEFLEAVADLTTQGGQSLVAAMREGRVAAVLKPLGVGLNNQVSSAPATTPTQASLLPSTQ
jgi:hypothetical protein